MTDRPAWIDADAHIFESSAIWDRLPKALRARVVTTPMTDDLVLRDTPVGCDTAIDGLPIPIVMSQERAKRFEKVLPAFHKKYHQKSGSDPVQYLKDMDLEGLDRVVIYPTLFLWASWIPQVDAQMSSAIATAYNDWIEEFCQADRRRLRPIAVVSLHDVDLAIQEVRRIATRGFVGVFVRPNPLLGRTLGHPDNHRFFQVLEELQLTVGIHEGQLSHMPTLGQDRTTQQWAMHCMSHPFEQMAAMLSIVEHSVFEKFPKLNFLFLEAGTALWVPYWLNRLDAERKLYRSSGGTDLLPSEYFTRQGFVTCEVDDHFLPATLLCMSDKKLLMSTDYPHMESPYPNSIAEFMKQDISVASRDRIGRLNALDAYPRLGE